MKKMSEYAYHVRDYNASKNILAKGLAVLEEAGVPVDIR